MGKIIGIILIVVAFVAFFFPRWIPRLLRRAGRVFGDVGRAGRELATGQEEPGSPLARYEVQAGKILVQKTLATTRLHDDEMLRHKVGEIGSHLAGHARRREIPYRFLVIEGHEPNAFAVPGGTIFITHSLLELCRDADSSIAGVLGHEISHVDRRHAIHNLAAQAAARTGVTVLAMGKAALLTHIVGGLEKLIVQGYRQDQEFEADLLGASLARVAGYDPRGLTRLLAELEKKHPEKGPLWEMYQYFRSHPPVGERIVRLEERFGAI